MHDYEKINNEIEEFMQKNEVRPSTIVEEVKNSTDKNKLLTLLTELLDIYRDIQDMLENKEFENVKDKILNSDVKNALVCESLMKILKDECLEKADIKKQNQADRIIIKKIESEKQELNIKISKMESDIEFAKRSNQELSRIIRDQKNLLITAKERAELERKACESIKNVNKELEILRIKAYDKVSTFEKEIQVLKDKLNEKDKTIKECHIQKKELENEKQQINKKINTLEKINETLKKKIDSKDKSLNLCNSELAKLISKNKHNEEILEDIKEKASYYERLYKSTNKQNEYLNSQLAKIINLENVDKLGKDDFKIDTSDLSLVTTQSKEYQYKTKLKKYKKKYKKHKTKEDIKEKEINEIRSSIEKLRFENKRLKDEKDQVISGNKKITDTLMSKVESLLEQNKGYQDKLVDKQVKFDTEDKFNESFKTVHEEINDSSNFNIHSRAHDPWKKHAESPNLNKLRYDDFFGRNGETKIKGNDDSTLFLDNNDFRKNKDFADSSLTLDNTKYRRPFDLANEYEDDVVEEKKELKSYKNVPNLIIPRNFYSSLARKPETVKNANKINNGFNMANKNINKKNENEFKFKNDDHNINEDDFGLKNIDIDEIKSNDSIKTVKTTSSLKNMLKKTEDLQNRFEDLEKQLDEINESDLPPSNKIHDQIKAYTDYYYSDYLDLSNENDIL